MERELSKDNIEHSEQNQLTINIEKCLDLLKYSTNQWSLFFDNIKELNKLTNKDLKSVLQNEVPFNWRWTSAFYYEYKIGENIFSIRYSQSSGSTMSFCYNNDKYTDKPITIEETIEAIEYYETASKILQDFNTKLSKIQQLLLSKNLINNL